MPKYAATGEEVAKPPQKVTPKSIRELTDPALNPGNQERERLAERRWTTIMEADKNAHDAAVSAFDFAYKDVTGNPTLLREVVIERQRLINEAAEKREVINWHKAYPEIGEKIRKQAGLPSAREQEHYGWIEEQRRLRGFKD